MVLIWELVLERSARISRRNLPALNNTEPSSCRTAFREDWERHDRGQSLHNAAVLLYSIIEKKGNLFLLNPAKDNKPIDLIFFNIILIKHQASHLDTLTSFLLLRPRNLESGMRYPLRTMLFLFRALHTHTIVETFNQQHLLRCLMPLVIPPLALTVLDPQRLAGAVAVRVDDGKGYEIILGYRLRMSHGEGIPLDGLDRSPDVDDLHAPFHEPLGVVGQVEWDA